MSGAAPGGRATVGARTAAGASCSITYRTPAGTLSTVQGLTPRSADGNGLVTWSWSYRADNLAGDGQRDGHLRRGQRQHTDPDRVSLAALTYPAEAALRQRLSVARYRQIIRE